MSRVELIGGGHNRITGNQTEAILLQSLRCIVLLAVTLALITGCDPGAPVDSSRVDPPPPVVADLSGADREIGEALGHLLDNVRAEPAQARHRGVLAMAYEVNGFAGAALESYRQAETMDPTEPRWPYFQALLVAHRGDLGQALGHLDRALRIDDGYGPAWLWRGTWLLDQNRLPESRQAFRRAAEIVPGAPARAGLARVALRLNQPQQALDILLPLQEVSPAPYVVQLIGQSYRQLGEADLAREALMKVDGPAPVVWQDPRSREKQQYELSLGATIARARKLILAGETTSALALIEPLWPDYPAHQGLLGALAEAYRLSGRDDEALAVLEKGVEAHPDFYGIHLNLADHYLRFGDQTRAMAHLDRVIELNPRVGWAHAQRGLILVNQGRVGDGLAAFQDALRQDPSNPQVHYYVGMVHASARHWQRAIDAFRESVDLDSDFGFAQLALGRSLTMVGDYEGADTALGNASRLGVPEGEVRAAMNALAGKRGESE